MTIQENDIYIKYRLNKAKQTLAEVDLHIKNKLWNTAVNRCIMHVFML